MHEEIESEVKSFTINDDKLDILNEIFKGRPKVICFSCYIWNIDLIYELCRDIKKIDEKVKLILGGPEVTYEPAEALFRSKADLIIRGEGETVIVDAVSKLLISENPDSTGCCFFKNGEVIDNGIARTSDLGSIASPFNEYMMEKESGKLIYYEASRGCPFNCIYCLSSADKGVRFFPLGRVFDDLNAIMIYNPEIVKFTDRSFNTDEKRTLQILEFIKKADTDACFHLEIFPGGLTEDVMRAFEEMPSGRVQLEAGIQSCNIDTLHNSGRYQDPEQALSNMKRMVMAGNMHIHLDLIAGLPNEDMESFRDSFDQTIRPGPHMLQVGFLKLLKGTSARQMEGYEYEENAPYEILLNQWITFRELNEIRGVAKCIDLFYNTGRFKTFLSYMHEKSKSPYIFYKNLYDYLHEKKINLKGISRTHKYEALAGFSNRDELACEYLRYDFMSSYSSRDIPSVLGEGAVPKSVVFNYLKSEDNRNAIFPAKSGYSPKKLYKICNIDTFRFESGLITYLFKYDERDKVTGLFPAIPIKI